MLNSGTTTGPLGGHFWNMKDEAVSLPLTHSSRTLCPVSLLGSNAFGQTSHRSHLPSPYKFLALLSHITSEVHYLCASTCLTTRAFREALPSSRTRPRSWA